MKYKTQPNISNPKLAEDARTLLHIDISHLFSTPNNQDLIHLFTRIIERIELVHHLIISGKIINTYRRTKSRLEFGENNEAIHIEDYEIVIFNHDFSGFDYDAESLANYLLLTVIELLSGEQVYKKWDDYLIESMNSRGAESISKSEIAELSKDYQNKYGLRINFVSFFRDKISDDVKKEILSHFVIANIKNGRLDVSSFCDWRKKSKTEKVEKLGKYFYDNVRSSFTHNSVRTFSFSTDIRFHKDTSKPILIQKGEDSDLFFKLMMRIISDELSILIKK